MLCVAADVRQVTPAALALLEGGAGDGDGEGFTGAEGEVAEDEELAGGFGVLAAGLKVRGKCLRLLLIQPGPAARPLHSIAPRELPRAHAQQRAYRPSSFRKDRQDSAAAEQL